MKYLISIFFLVTSLAGFGQKQKADSVKKDFLPTGIRVGVDAASLIRTETDDSFSGYELNADVDFYRYFLTVDYGSWARTYENDVDRYENEGTYMRVGVDVNFLKKDPEKNMFFFGARYGWGTYDEVFSVTVDDPVFGMGTNTYSYSNLKASWGELTTGLRVKMWKFFWLGYTARYKFGLKTNESGDFVTYDVPGYGKTSNNSTWGFNYQVLFRIPLRKSNVPLQSSQKKK